MPTLQFGETLREIAAENPAFAANMLEGAVTALFAGGVDEGRIQLRTHINAAMGFEELARLTGRNPKSLMRMIGPNGNSTANNLFDIISQLGRAERVTIEAHVKKTVVPALG